MNYDEVVDYPLIYTNIYTCYIVIFAVHHTPFVSVHILISFNIVYGTLYC